jgi:hypothetical protein
LNANRKIACGDPSKSDQCLPRRATVWRVCKVHEKCYGYGQLVEFLEGELLEGMGGRYYGAREASFEAKASEESRTGVGSRWVVVAGGRRIRGNRWAGCGYTDAEDSTESRNHSR